MYCIVLYWFEAAPLLQQIRASHDLGLIVLLRLRVSVIVGKFTRFLSCRIHTVELLLGLVIGNLLPKGTKN